MTLDQPPFVRFARADLDRSIPERFRQQVRHHGHRLAVQWGDDRLTYTDLDHLSNRIAHAILAQRGAGAEPVVVLLPQGILNLAATLGVLKAGKFYVPLDPRAPEAELGAQIDASQAALLIADRRTEAVAERHARRSRPVLRVDRVDPSARADDPRVAIPAEAYAYIYYTSGSTGAPKGVVDSHRNVIHNIMRYTNALKIGPVDRLTLVQAPHFSGAVSSMFAAVLNGAAVFPFDLRGEAIGAIARAISDHRITIYHSVPAIFARIAATGLAFPAMRLIRLEGDQASARHVALFQRHFGPTCVLVNGLGATETGITRQWFVTAAAEVPGGPLPLGHPTEDMDTLILDESGREVPAGDVGEIVIRSRYLALGYWQDAERTNAAFRPEPGDSGKRRYLSGDLGRIAPDGRLEYFGRRDFRVRLGGRWLDTSAIETALGELDQVREAAVRTYEVAAARVQLVAYLVPADGATPSLRQIRAALLARGLAADSLPTRLVLLESLPLSDNFKVDRAALPPPDAAPAILDTPTVSPEDPIEAALVDIWREVLGLDRIGTGDAFFDLGGDSLAALEVAHLIEARIGADFPVSTVLEAATIAEMAERVRGARPARPLVPIRTSGALTPWFLIHDQSGEVLCFRELVERLGDDRPVYGLRAVDFDTGAVPDITAVAANYVTAMRTVQPVGPYLISGNCFGGVIALEAAQQLVRAGEQVARLILLDTAFPSGALRERCGRLVRLRSRVADLSLAGRLQFLASLLRERIPRRRSGGGADSRRRRQLVQDACRAAGHRYRPGHYDGPATLILIDQPTNQGGWGRLMTNLEVVVLPLQSAAATADVVRQPYIDQVAAIFRAVLARAD